ncbi:hypothetical protein JAAARDRAFT_190954 [Jaapia argillacea MUCL 33604]|uniref:Uncharacterized protein n=1 Tax=Jaapia argillacea MUCL 33604 TaxID=933084 RepID=A0A067QBB9_9AGAM|nr:hypothetical protein JAAARDRAFT_190954 [Jaapia argillacea MUCL 33604]
MAPPLIRCFVRPFKSSISHFLGANCYHSGTTTTGSQPTNTVPAVGGTIVGLSTHTTLSGVQRSSLIVRRRTTPPETIVVSPEVAPLPEYQTAEDQYDRDLHPLTETIHHEGITRRRPTKTDIEAHLLAVTAVQDYNIRLLVQPTPSLLVTASATSLQITGLLYTQQVPQHRIWHEANHLQEVTTHYTHYLPLRPRKPAPIPPTQPAPIIPPPPLPELSSAKPPFKEEKQLTPEEKRTAWVGRIKLIVDCVNARIEHMKRENDVRRFQRLFESRRYSRVAEEDRVRLEAELAATKAQCDEKKKDLNLCVTRLLDCDFWPVLPRGDGTKAVDEKFQDLAKEVRELKATAAQLDDNLRILLAKQSVPPLTSAQPHPKPPERMDVDDESSSRPTKRRRLSSEPEPTREATVSAEERDMIKDEIDALQHRIADLENNETQHTATLLEEFDSLIDSKIEEANSSFLGGNSLPGPISSSIASQYSSKLEEVEANLARTGGDVDYIVKEVAGLITDTDALKRENQRLREDNEKWKTKFTELEEKQLRSEALLEQHKNEIAALNTAVKDQLARISARPPPVPPPSLDSIVEAVREPIIQAVQESVQPQLDQLRATIEKMLQDHSDQLCQAVWSKLHAVLRMVEHVKRWVEQVGDDPMVTKGPPILNGH